MNLLPLIMITAMNYSIYKILRRLTLNIYIFVLVKVLSLFRRKIKGLRGLNTK